MRDRPRAAQRPLDILNLALVDVNGAIKPYLNVFLYVNRDCADATVGLIGTISGLFGLAVQAPLGAAVEPSPTSGGRRSPRSSFSASAPFCSSPTRCFAIHASVPRSRERPPRREKPCSDGPKPPCGEASR